MSKHLKRYCRAVRRDLPCSGKLKQKILTEISMSVRTYLEENPSASYTEIENKFGTPQQITSAYLDEMDHQVLAKELKLKSKIVKIVATALIASLLMFAATLITVIHDDKTPGYLVVEIK